MYRKINNDSDNSDHQADSIIYRFLQITFLSVTFYMILHNIPALLIRIFNKAQDRRLKRQIQIIRSC
jgi:hypothetical protein